MSVASIWLTSQTLILTSQLLVLLSILTELELKSPQKIIQRPEFKRNFTREIGDRKIILQKRQTKFKLYALKFAEIF